MSGQSAFMAARLGDRWASRSATCMWAIWRPGIANVVNIFQPDTLAIGGGVSNESDEQLLHPLQQLVERETIPCSAGKKTRIVKASWAIRRGSSARPCWGRKNGYKGDHYAVV